MSLTIYIDPTGPCDHFSDGARRNAPGIDIAPNLYRYCEAHRPEWDTRGAI